MKPNPRRAIGQLVAGEAKVEEDPVEGDETGFARRRRARALKLAWRMTARSPNRARTVEASRTAAAIGVEAEQTAVRSHGLQESLGVPTATDRAVCNGAAGTKSQRGENLVDEDRQMPFSHA